MVPGPGDGAAELFGLEAPVGMTINAPQAGHLAFFPTAGSGRGEVVA